MVKKFPYNFIVLTIFESMHMLMPLRRIWSHPI